MTTSDADRLREEVASLLSQNGYIELSPRVLIGDIELEVHKLWEGPAESLDLSIVADRPESREELLRLYWQAQRLTRALDAAGSRRTLTVILIGEPSPYAGIGEFLELARVLVVDGSLPADRMLGPLLRLRLPNTSSAQVNGTEMVRDAVGNKRSGRELSRLIEAASAGPRVVGDRYRAWIKESFVSNEASSV